MVQVAFALAINALSIATGIAVLKYRLYDIDVVIHRTFLDRDQLDGKEGEGHRVHAVEEGEEPVEVRISLRFRHLLLLLLLSPALQER